MLLLLDRDGVLNEDCADYVKSPDELRFLPRAASALARFNAADWQVALCTNQSVVGRNIISERQLGLIHDYLQAQLAVSGARLDAIFYATDHPDAPTERRKPGPGMLIEAMARFGCDPSHAVMVGDSLGDMQAAKSASVARILVRTGHGSRVQAAGLLEDVMPVTVCEDLWAAADLLLGPLKEGLAR